MARIRSLGMLSSCLRPMVVRTSQASPVHTLENSIANHWSGSRTVVSSRGSSGCSWSSRPGQVREGVAQGSLGARVVPERLPASSDEAAASSSVVARQMRSEQRNSELGSLSGDVDNGACQLALALQQRRWLVAAACFASTAHRLDSRLDSAPKQLETQK
jgi:hypothetical protein